LEETVSIFQESYDSVQGLPGFEGAYLLVERDKGVILTLTFWNSEVDLQGSATTAEQILSRAGERAGLAGPPQIETFEVLGEV
jgi:heme-degrading monooxygenase HmoA